MMTIFIRFLLVGILNTGFSYGLYVIFLSLGFNYIFANLLATVAGIVFSFRSQGKFVFSNTDPRRFIRFFCGWLVIWCINIFLIKGFQFVGLNAYWAGAVALFPTVAISFIVQKYFVFRKSRRNLFDHENGLENRI